MNLIVCKSKEEIARKSADCFASHITKKPNAVLGLATGSTPIGMYNCLVKDFEEGKIDFSKVLTYNLDEYYPLAATSEQSYRYYMEENLFSRVNVKKENTHVPDGLSKEPESYGKTYDEAIKNSGGLDILVLGIGENGHIGFNEPDSFLVAETHLCKLTESTIEANARFFDKKEDVPTHAITMGLSSIMQSKEIILLAFGANKHKAISALLDGKITTDVPLVFVRLP